jgi:hypothetical protein
MANVNFNELFGSFSAADALAATESKPSSNYSNDGLYKPSIKDEKCTDQNYRALVRFIPFYNEGKWRTTVSRWECFLKDVNGDNGVFVVSPKTNGQKCPMRTLSYKLYTSDSAIDKANSKKIQVYQQYYALVEVVKDVQHPEYDGKVFVYQFGQKINDKIENAMKSTEFTEGFNPFDLYSGRLFEINLTKDTTKKMEGDNNRTITNYDACRFTEKSSPIHFPVGNETMTLTADNKESQKAFFNWLENETKIKDYFWKEWDAETTAKVNANLATYTSGYVAPRTPVATAHEEISDVSVKVDNHQEEETNVSIDDLPSEDIESVSADDDAWINSVLNS